MGDSEGDEREATGKGDEMRDERRGRGFAMGKGWEMGDMEVADHGWGSWKRSGMLRVENMGGAGGCKRQTCTKTF